MTRVMPDKSLERTRAELSAKPNRQHARRSAQPLNAMRILIAFLTSAALATASLAAPPAAWIQVQGGAWNPDAQITADVQRGIQSYVEAQAISQGRKLRLWAEYSFQYQGRIEKGVPHIYVNAFCNAAGAEDLHSRFRVVLDGGTCFFNVAYDPKTRRFTELRINGEA